VDAKNQFEPAFALFEPDDNYHLQRLAQQREQPQTRDIIIYHPFTFDLPKNKKLPPLEIITYPLPEIRRDGLGFLLESEPDTTPAAMSMFIEEADRADAATSLYDVLYNVQEKVKATTGKKKKQDLKNLFQFGLMGSAAGSMKEFGQLQFAFEPFLKKDFMIQSADCPLNLDIKKMFRNHRAYHILSTKWIKDEKMRTFAMFMWVQLIIKYREECRHPVCIIFDEITTYAPYNAKGYKSHVANLLRNIVKFRNMGKGGMLSLTIGQNFQNIDTRVRTNPGKTLFGNFGVQSEVEALKKAFGAHMGPLITSLQRGEFVDVKNALQD